MSQKFPQKEISINALIWPFVVFLIFLLFVVFLVIDDIGSPDKFISQGHKIENLELSNIQKFASEEDFLDYLARARELSEVQRGTDFLTPPTHPEVEMDFEESIAVPSPIMSDASEVAPSEPDRFSETNVQVEGIDEPDIVKTDGVHIYISQDLPRYGYRYSSEGERTKAVKAFPVEDLEFLSEIKKGGNLLLKDDVLIIFQNESILGYNVQDPQAPKEVWEIEMDSNTQLTDARLKGDTIYLMTNTTIRRDDPCRIRPLTFNNEELVIECTDIYYPGVILPIDTTYTAVKVDFATGEKEDEVSFVGSRNSSIVYMSHDNLYLSYFQQANMVSFMAEFFTKECKDIIPANVIERMERLDGYDISLRAKMIEMEVIFQDFSQSLSGDERLRIENELSNRIGGYYQKNNRELESTGIIKIGLGDMEVKAAGNVPGNMLNQFAMDEHQGNLRVATTIGERFNIGRGMAGPGSVSGVESANDVYILDGKLQKQGSVKDLGLDERVYAVRFIGDMGYVVTFREIDPFYILDLSDPSAPEMKGELKIPGYSSYLHPIDENRMLGIGKEDWNVKASLFDISNPYDPREIDKYILSERWSEAVHNHRAFLMDKEHGIFFLPGSRGGYIFSYENNNLSLVRAIEEAQTKRAIYIDDYLYVISERGVLVIDQENWENVSRINF